MKTYPKIDLFFAGDYLCSTNQAKTCKEAIKTYLDRAAYYRPYTGIVDRRVLKAPHLLKARFDKGGQK